MYIAYLSRSLKYVSVVNYLSAVRFLHASLGYDIDCLSSFTVTATIKGYKRLMGSPNTQKLPLSYDMLCDIISSCDSSSESGYMACILVGFFAFLRKANLCPNSVAQFNTQFHLSRGAIKFTDYGALISVFGSKVIQFKEKVLEIPLIKHTSASSVCPVKALKKHFDRFPAPAHSPAFLRDNGQAITHRNISEFLKKKLKLLGIEEDKISMHSLRRGGAT